MVCWVLRLSSASLSKAPQRVRSLGIGLAATHLAFTKALKSWQALMLVSSSLTSNALLVAAGAAVAATVPALAGAAAGVSVGCSCLPQAASERARLTARATGFRCCLDMDGLPLREIARWADCRGARPPAIPGGSATVENDRISHRAAWWPAGGMAAKRRPGRRGRRPGRQRVTRSSLACRPDGPSGRPACTGTRWRTPACLTVRRSRGTSSANADRR